MIVWYYLRKNLKKNKGIKDNASFTRAEKKLCSFFIFLIVYIDKKLYL